MRCHFWLLLVGTAQLLEGVHYILQGGYYGCDRNDCSADFIFDNAMFAICSVFGAILVRMVWAILGGLLEPPAATAGDVVELPEPGSSTDK